MLCRNRVLIFKLRIVRMKTNFGNMFTKKKNNNFGVFVFVFIYLFIVMLEKLFYKLNFYNA